MPSPVVPTDSRPSADTGQAPDAASGSSCDGPRSSGPSIRFSDRSGPPRREAPQTRSISRLVQPARTVFQHPIGIFLVSWLNAEQPQGDEVHDHVRLTDDCLQASYGRRSNGPYRLIGHRSKRSFVNSAESVASIAQSAVPFGTASKIPRVPTYAGPTLTRSNVRTHRLPLQVDCV